MAMTESGPSAPIGIEETAPRRRGSAALVDFLANPMALIAMALLAVALWATPHYLAAMERELLDGELWLTICGGLAPGTRNRAEIRRPLL